MNEHHHEHGEIADIRIAFFLNLGFALFEIIGGLLINSVAILSDAVHDLGDSISLGAAWFLGGYAQKGSDQIYTYGYHRFSLVGALLNSIILVGGGLFVLSEAIPRLMEPEAFNAPGMLLIALVGIAVNGIAVLRLRGGESMNVRVVSWHLLEDVLGWIAVLIVAVVSIFVDAPILDPILSVLITIYILANALINLRETVTLFLQASPQGVDIEQIKADLNAIDEVQSIHHTHIWSLDGEHNVFTTHLVIPKDVLPERIRQIKREAVGVVSDIKLKHAAIEIDFGPDDCSMTGLEDENENSI